MKNQYVGDIGDYGKYSLLRFLSLQGIRIGINWYLTENDSSTDGNHTDYLKNASKRALDPDIYDALKEITERYEQSNRTVQMIPKAELIPNALFFDKKLPLGQMNPMVRAWRRRLWFRHSRAILENTDMVFADPDNGVTYKKTARNKGCEKYVLPEELAQYYYAGKDVVFYCHKGRRIRAEWEQTKGQIRDYICDAALFVLTFHRGTQRSYIFVVHPERAEKYTTLLTKFLLSTEWGKTKAFTREDVIERTTNSTIDMCKKQALLNYFQNAFITKQEKERALRMMANEEIDELVVASSTEQEEQFYKSHMKSGFDAPTIGVRHPRGSKIIKNADGTISIVPPPPSNNGNPG